MKTISVNEDAMRDVLLTVMNPEALEGLMVAYRLVDAAERRGMEAGFISGTEVGYADAFDAAATEADANEEETFRNGWYFGHAAGVKETPRPMIYISGPLDGDAPICLPYIAGADNELTTFQGSAADFDTELSQR